MLPVDPTLTVYHSKALTGLSETTTYYFRVLSTDADGNASTSNENNFTTTAQDKIIISSAGGGSAPPPPPLDITPPVISDVSSTEISAFSAVISFTTNKDTRGFVHFGESTNYNLVATDAILASRHSVKLEGLKLGTTYHSQVEAIDKNGNAGDSPDQTFKTKFFAESIKQIQQVENVAAAQDLIEHSIESILPSLLPPVIQTPVVSEITESGAKVSWKTNVASFGLADYAPEETYDAKKDNPYGGETSDLQTKSTDHSLTLTGLKSNTRYHFSVKSFVLPQVVGASDDATFFTKTAAIHPRVAETLNNGLRVVWSTDEPASSIVTFKNLKTGEINQKTKPDKTTDHDIFLDNLTPATSYEISISGYNDKENLVQSGETITARTSQDVTPPVISSVKIDNAFIPGRTDRLQTVVSWKTDEPATSLVFYQGETAGGKTEFKSAGTTAIFETDHNVILIDLRPGQIYRIRLESSDTAGNKAQTPIRMMITPQQSESIVDVVIKNFEDTFNFLQKLR